jgi:carbon-monoxide dehydrogenase medium subunit
VIPAQLAYTRPETLDEALSALSEPEAKILAGGQSLVSVLKLRLVRPSVLVDIARLDLRGVGVEQDELRIGALTTWAELVAARELERPALRGIAECAEGIGDLQVKNRGTIGGSIAHADPASDMPAMLIALDAGLTLRSADAERLVSADEFFLGPFLTALEPHELLTEIVVPFPSAGSGSAYEAIEHPASGFALAGAAVRAQVDGTRTIGVTGIGARPFRLEATLEEAEVYGDHYATEAYKRQVVQVVLARATARAQARAEEDRTWTA